MSIDVCGELHMMFTEHIMQGKGKKDVEKMIEEEEIDEDAGAIVEGAEPFSLPHPRERQTHGCTDF